MLPTMLYECPLNSENQTASGVEGPAGWAIAVPAVRNAGASQPRPYTCAQRVWRMRKTNNYRRTTSQTSVPPLQAEEELVDRRFQVLK